VSYSQHSRSIRAALAAGDTLADILARLGTTEHPRGLVLTAYRTARRALAGNLANPRAVSDALAMLRYTLEAAITEALRTATDAGLKQAERDLGIYKMRPATVAAPQTAPAIEAALATFTQQAQAVAAYTQIAPDPAVILGDASRAGILSPAPVIRETSRLAAATLNAVAFGVLSGSIDLIGYGGEWYHQAIAAIDERTTDCCLRVNGQEQPLHQPFHLTGSPRFADYIDNPPFHWSCRSASATVHRADLGDALTQQMRSAGKRELDARSLTGGRAEIHPSHARSRRP